MVIFRETTVPLDHLEIQSHVPSVHPIPNSNHASTTNLRGTHSIRQYANLERMKLGSQHVHVLLQVAEDRKTLKLQFIPLIKHSGSTSSNYSPRSSSKPLHLVFNTHIIPDIFLQQDEANQTLLCWVLTSNEDLHRIHLPAPDQLHLFVPTPSSHSVQHLQSLNTRYPMSMKPVNSNSVAVACQDGSIVFLSIQMPNRIIGNHMDSHHRKSCWS